MAYSTIAVQAQHTRFSETIICKENYEIRLFIEPFCSNPMLNCRC